jgi:hypothetical protein
MARDYKWLPLDLVEEFEPLAESLDVSRVARSSKGFLPQFKAAGGDPDQLTDHWRRKRNGFVARHMAQVNQNDEDLWDKDGIPSRRHLALIMWAYSPQEDRLERFLDAAATSLEGLSGSRRCELDSSYPGAPGVHSWVRFRVGEVLYTYELDSPYLYKKIVALARRSCFDALNMAKKAGDLIEREYD